MKEKGSVVPRLAGTATGMRMLNEPLLD